MLADFLDVQLIEALPALSAQARIEVMTINVSDDTFHNTAFAQKGTAPLAGGVGLEMLSPAGLLI